MKSYHVLSLLLPLLLVCLFVPPAQAGDPSSVTFAIISSAKTATPNLRVAYHSRELASAPTGEAVQAFAPRRVVNYYLTKSTTVSLPVDTVAYQIQTAQDTKLFFGSDLTNYLIVYADAPVTFGVVQ